MDEFLIKTGFILFCMGATIADSPDMTIPCIVLMSGLLCLIAVIYRNRSQEKRRRRA